MTEKPRFQRRTVFAKNLGFGVGFGYRNNTSNVMNTQLITRVLSNAVITPLNELELDASVNPSHPTDDIGEER